MNRYLRSAIITLLLCSAARAEIVLEPGNLPPEPAPQPLSSGTFTVLVDDGTTSGQVLVRIDAAKIAQWAARTLTSKTGRAQLADGALVAERPNAKPLPKPRAKKETPTEPKPEPKSV